MFKTTLLAQEASARRAALFSASRLRHSLKALLRDQLLRWPLWNPVALTLGAAVYLAAPAEPHWLILLAPLAAFALLAFATRNSAKGIGSFLFGLALMTCLGATAGKVRSETVRAPFLTRQTSAVRIEGVLVEIDASDRSQRFRMRVHAIEGMPQDQTPRFVRFSVRDVGAFIPGEAISCRVILSPPPRPAAPGDYEFHRDAYFQQLGAVGFSVGRCTRLDLAFDATPLEALGNRLGAWRRALSQAIVQAAGDEGGPMSAAVITGDRSYISAADADALRGSGLAHLLSISGLHMALAGGVFFFAIRMVWRLVEPLALRAPADRVAAAGAILGCTFYLILAGAEVATLRAYVMALIAFGAKVFDRPALSVRSLAVALFLAVLVQPETVLSPGFQMSYAATAALIALYEAWPRRRGGGKPSLVSRALGWAAVTAGTSIVASTATAPFALYHFNRSAPLSILANLVTSPIISFWTAPTAALAAFGSLFGLQDLFLGWMGQSLALVQAIANWANTSAPTFDFPRMSAAALFLFALSLAVVCIQRGAARLAALVPAAFGVFLWITAPLIAAYVATDGSVFIRSGADWMEVTSWREKNGLNPLSIRTGIVPFQCPKDAATCSVTTRDGVYVFQPAPARGCLPERQLTFHPLDGSADLSFDPCDWADGGGVLELTHPGRRLRGARIMHDRPWDGPSRAMPER